MSGNGNENTFEGLEVKPACQHRALQLCKEQNDIATVYVCGRCSSKFQVEPLAEPKPQPKEPMLPKHSVPWGLRGRQA
jgi:hypothetical protein